MSYNIILNGKPSYTFKPQRGIRQGDPLSPYLFIICANVFFELISKSQLDKSELLFSKKVQPQAKSEVMNTLPMQVATIFSKYLSMQTLADQKNKVLSIFKT